LSALSDWQCARRLAYWTGDENDDPEAHGWIALVAAHPRARLRSGIV